MNCDDIKDLVDAHIIGVLDKEQDKQIKEHIQNCPDCKQYYNESILSWQKLHALPMVTPSISYADRILNNRKRGRRILKSGIWTVFIILVFSLIIMFLLFGYHKEYPQHHINHLEKAIWRYYAKNKSFPMHLKQLKNMPEKMFKKNVNKDVLDIWGVPYKYKSPGKQNPTFFDLYSYGQNKKDNKGKKDDIKNWKENRG